LFEGIRAGLAGFESTNTSGLFSWQNSIASLGASALTPLFAGGRIRAGVDRASAAYRQSLAQYQKTVLTAYQEVEDQLAALRILSGEAQSTADAVSTAQQAETIALNRYRSGLVSYLDVVYAQTALLSNQRTAAQIEGCPCPCGAMQLLTERLKNCGAVQQSGQRVLAGLQTQLFRLPPKVGTAYR